MMLLSILFKATIAMALGLTTVWTARRSRASVRHALLGATFGVLLLLPLAAVIERPVRIRLPLASQPQIVSNGAKIVTLPPTQGRAQMLAGTQPSEPSSMSTLLVTLWAVGAAMFFAPVLIGLWQVRSLRWSAIRWRETNGVQVLLHESLAGPMTCGVIQPGILLPRDAESWSEADLTRALAHELEHTRRADWLVHCVARVICAAYWFHPLVWMAWRQLTLEAERACDDAVLTGSDATAYGDQLVSLARRMSESAKAPALAMANRAELSARVSSVLDERRKRGRAGARVVALVCVGAALFAVGLAPLTTVASAQDVPKPRMMVESNLVQVQVEVTDGNGGTIDSLSASDFVVSEDDSTQKIRFFENRGSGLYVLGYYGARVKDDNAYRTIRVNLRGDTTARLHYRPGYFTSSRRPLPQTASPVQTVPPGWKPPILLRKVEPEYADEARQAKYQGTVMLSVLVDTEGVPTNMRVIRAVGLGLDEKAKEAVAKWRFKPASQDGQPIEMETEVEVSFRLM